MLKALVKIKVIPNKARRVEEYFFKVYRRTDLFDYIKIKNSFHNK